MKLGRGLASLIPQRDQSSAEEIIDEIDSMELSDEEESQTTVVEKNEEVKDNKSNPISSKTINVDIVEEDGQENDDRTQDNDEIEIAPTTPLVTPLTMDPQSGLMKEIVSDQIISTKKKKEVVKKSARKISKTAVVDAADDSKTKKNTKVKQSPVVAKDADEVLGQAVEQIALGDIEVNPLQPRHTFDPGEQEELQQSLEQHGILQPLVVTKKDDGTGYRLIAGERRLRAARELKWDTVPAIVRGGVTTDRNRLELALTENVQRQNLNPVEEAMGYQRLNEEYGMTHEEIGQRVGRSRVGVTNIIRLLQLPAEIQRGLIEEKISVGHARAILMIPDDQKQVRFYQHLLDEGLTVRKAENRARRIQRTMKLSDPMRKKTRGRPALALKYDGLLEEKFGYNARVKFDSTKNRFEVVFHAFSEGEAQELVNRLLGIESVPENVDQDVIDD